MPIYGVTPQGFNRKTEADIIRGFERRQRATISATIDVSPTSVTGQMNGIYGRELGEMWELLEIAYHSYDPDMAEGFLLDSLCKLTATRRRLASHSHVILVCGLDEGATIEAGIHMAAVAGSPDNLWTPIVNFTAPTAGEHEVVFRAVEPGPIRGNPNTITVIHVPALGWNSVNNPEAAAPGRTVDPDNLLRQRRREQLSARGAAIADAINAKVSNVAGIENVRVLVNNGDVVDNNGVPPHSVEVVVFDGVVPAANNDAIAQAILQSVAGGIRSVGSEFGTARDMRGSPQVCRFTRVSVVDVYCEIDVDVETPDYIGDGPLAIYLTDAANKLMTAGGAVKARQVDSLVYDAAGVSDVTDFRLGTSPSPSGTDNLQMTIRQIAHFDSSRVTVNSTPA